MSSWFIFFFKPAAVHQLSESLQLHLVKASTTFLTVFGYPGILKEILAVAGSSTCRRLKVSVSWRRGQLDPIAPGAGLGPLNLSIFSVAFLEAQVKGCPPLAPGRLAFTSHICLRCLVSVPLSAALGCVLSGPRCPADHDKSPSSSCCRPGEPPHCCAAVLD